VLEAVPGEVAQTVTRQLDIATIGIGASGDCDGQVLVWHDLVGLLPGAPFRFVKRYAERASCCWMPRKPLSKKCKAVFFLLVEHEYSMPDEERERWLQATEEAAKKFEA
jgi:3-methyl-2-oxobutanoate hydroxymethyltransferase